MPSAWPQTRQLPAMSCCLLRHAPASISSKTTSIAGGSSRSASSRWKRFLPAEARPAVAKRVSIDRWIFCITLVLVFIGLVMVFSASAVMASERFGSAYTFLLRQMAWAAAGLIAMLLLMNCDYHRLKHPAIVFSLVGVTTLLLVAVFFLDRSHNTHRWLRLGPLSLQPSELAKPVIILFLAYFLEGRTATITDWRRTLLPAVVPTA